MYTKLHARSSCKNAPLTLLPRAISVHRRRNRRRRRHGHRRRPAAAAVATIAATAATAARTLLRDDYAEREGPEGSRSLA